MRSRRVGPIDLIIYGPVTIRRVVVQHLSTSGAERTLPCVSCSLLSTLSGARCLARQHFFRVRCQQCLDFFPDGFSDFCPSRHAINVVPGKVITAE